MMCFKDATFAVTLVVMALALSGCGSSGKGGSPSPPPEPAAPLDLASQSVQGHVQATVNYNDTKYAVPPQPVGLFIDAENMNVRVEASADATMSNISVLAHVKAVVNVTEKRVTVFVNVSAKDKDAGINKHVLNCTYKTIDQMPDAKTLKSLISSVLADQPVTKAADGNKQMTLNIDPSTKDPKVKGKVTVTAEFSADNVLKKVSSKMDLTAPEKEDSHGSMVADTESKAGAPDASKFVVDKSWGDCKEANTTDLLDDPSIPPHLRLPFDLVLQMLEIKPETKTATHSELIAI